MLDDQQLQNLLSASAKGDQVAFQSLYELTSPYLYALVRGMLNNLSLTDDIIQEAYVQIWTSAADYNPEKGALIAWMTGITRYRTLDCIRRQKSQKTRIQAATNEPGWSDPEPPEMTKYSRETQKLVNCLKPIKPEQRNSIMLAFYHGLSHSEVAEHIKAPVGSVKSWIRRGLASVRECLQR